MLSGIQYGFGRENCTVLVPSEQHVTHPNSHGILAVMLGKCRVDDRKAKEAAFVYMYASPELLSGDQC